MDPRLILVFELGDAIDLDEFRKAELLVLDASDSKIVVAFADDPQLARFQERLERYQAGPVGGAQRPPLEGFFDAIEIARRLLPDEKLTGRLKDRLATASGDDELRLDVECWHPDDERLARQWLDELVAAVDQAGGRVADRYFNRQAQLSILRCYVPSAQAAALAKLDQVARVDLLPRPALEPALLYTISAAQLPTVPPPQPHAPIVGLIDSGIRSGHPLIGPHVTGVETLVEQFEDGEDECGHGTQVAGLLLHGPLADVVNQRAGSPPPCRLLSVRVLDHQKAFPDDVLWEHELEKAIRYCAKQGARIINLSVGDSDTIYRPPRPTPVAALLDTLTRELGLVIVVSAGNVPPASYIDPLPEVVDTYPVKLRDYADGALLDPAPAALALTVGATCGPHAAGGLLSREDVTLRPIGAEGWPSPFSRRGPGIRDAIKPELSHLGGSHAIALSGGRGFVPDKELGVITTGGGSASARDRLLEVVHGTSFAAPLVTRVVAATAKRNPDVGPNLLRALVLQSATETAFVTGVTQGTEGARRKLILASVGYGSPRLQDAISSREHRAVLVAEATMQVNDVHIYEVPVPESFFSSGGTREVVVSLCFDPPTRNRRLDYLGCRMEFRLVRGVQLEVLHDIILASNADLSALPDEDAVASRNEEETGPATAPSSLSDLGSLQVDLQPSATRRSLGANQLGRKVWKQRLDRQRGESWYLVVKNTNGWMPEGSQQDYALAVALTRDADHDPIYIDLEARLRAEVEIELER